MLGLGIAAALVIGTVQGLAIVPGISRSGATIGAALLLGVGREEAVEFSFLVSVPAIAGAAVLQADAAAFTEVYGAWPAYLASMIAAVMVGYGALAWLVRLVRDDHFHRFAPYCLIVGVGVLVLLA